MNIEYFENIDPRPKRRKDKDNPYTLFSTGKDNEKPHFYVSFADDRGETICTEISEELFVTMNQYELDDLSHLNEVDNHYERGKVLESTLDRYVAQHRETLEEVVERKLTYEKVHKAIDSLSAVQQRRLRLYYFECKTLKEIGEIEGCEYQTVQKSIKKALRKIKDFLA